MEEAKKIEFVIPDVLSGMTEEEINEHEKRVIEYEKEMELKSRLSAFRCCGIGELYYDCDLKTFNTDYPKQKEMLNLARAFFSSVKSGNITNMLLYGNAGQGKSTLIIGLLKEFCKTVRKVVYGINQYYTICYITSKDLCDILEKTKSFSYNKSWDMILNDFAFYDVLAIDEVGKATSKFEWEVLFSILDKRIQFKKSTMFVSNLEESDLQSGFSDYGMSRLNYNGNLLKLCTSGLPDFRQMKN